MEILSVIGDLLSKFIYWIAMVGGSLCRPEGYLFDLLPFVLFGIAVSVFMVAFKAIRKVTWGA